jgi:subtilisin family serine protease
VTTRTWRVAACAAGFFVGLSSVSPALAEAPPSPEVQDIPAALQADLSVAEERTLTATTSGDGIPLAAFVMTPDGPEIVTLDAGSRTDATAAVSLLEAQPSVEAAEVSVPVRLTGGATYADYLYGNTMLRSEAAHASVDNPLSSAVVAVLDTGVSPHPELVGALLPGQNFTDSPGGASDATDRQGHGTHVAGTVAADAGSDVEGIAYGVKVMPVKVLGDNGSGWSDWIANGITWAADNGADVINMSLGGGGYSSVMASAIAYARSKNVTVIAAAGNDNVSTPFYPAAYPGVVAVSAVDETKAKAWFSNYGAYVDIAAPGVDILSTDYTGGFSFKSGTSMASPHVAGVAALVEAAAPGLTPAQVEQALIASASDLGARGRDDVYGYGLVDAVRAVQAANSLEDSGTLPPVVPGAPVMGTPVLGNGAVRVVWAAPASEGTSPVTSYTLRAYRGSKLLAKTTTTATKLLVPGLPNGTAHTFTVVANNTLGAGAAATVTATPQTTPGAPRLGRLTPGDGTAVVQWTAPSNGGSAITGYSVRVYRGNSQVTVVSVPGTATSTTVSGLTNGTAYTFVVSAQNAAGVGAVSARSGAVVPRTVPSAPTITSVTAGKSAASVAWAAAANGGSAVSAYVVRVYRGTSLLAKITVPARKTLLTVPRLTVGAEHSFTVTAVNAAGAGPVSAQSATVVPVR